MGTVIVAVDEPEVADAVLDAGWDYARLLDADLLVVTAVPEIPGPRGMPPLREATERAEELAGIAAERLRERGAERVAAAAGLGDPGSAICAAAERSGAELIVMGSRGHGRVVGALLGSATQHVTAHAPCPVLVVR